jgi:hypothetical protein
MTTDDKPAPLPCTCIHCDGVRCRECVTCSHVLSACPNQPESRTECTHVPRQAALDGSLWPCAYPTCPANDGVACVETERQGGSKLMFEPHCWTDPLGVMRFRWEPRKVV